MVIEAATAHTLLVLFYIGCSLLRPKWWANSAWHIVEGKTDLMSLIGLLQHPTLFCLDVILASRLTDAIFSLTSTPCDLQHSVNCTKFLALTHSLPQRSSDAAVAALKEGAKTVVRGKKAPRRRRKRGRGRGRVQEKPWKWPRGVVVRPKPKPKQPLLISQS